MIRVTIRASGTLGAVLRDLAGPAVHTANGSTVPKGPPGAQDRADMASARRQLPRSIKAYKPCPSCGSWRISLSRRRTWLHGLLSVFGIHAVRCTDCGSRFTHHAWHWAYLQYARCPKCANLRLHGWQEEYHLPPAYVRALTIVGARQQRCNPCRHNFVSFRPRWKPTESLLALLQIQREHTPGLSPEQARDRALDLMQNEQ